MFSCSQTLEVMLGHVMEECDICEARAAHVCSVCFSSDPIFVFQVCRQGRKTNNAAYATSTPMISLDLSLLPRDNRSMCAGADQPQVRYVTHVTSCRVT